MIFYIVVIQMKIKTEKLSAAEMHLCELLSAVWNNSDFIVGVLNSLNDDSARNEMIEFIENNDDATSEQIDLLSLHISQSRQGARRDCLFADPEPPVKQL